MMAAIRGAEDDKVLLIEQNEKLGKKLFITGKGRCNLCNDGEDELFFDSLHRNGRFMYSSYYSLTSYGLQYFFESGGVPLKVERGQRVFPVSDKSSDVIRRLERELLERKVEIRYNTKVLNVKKTGGKFCVQTDRGPFNGDKVIVSTGGITYKNTGSTGDGYRWAKEFGMNVIKPMAGLVGLRADIPFRESLQGLSLKNVELYAHTEDGEYSEFGEMLITHYGVSGPIVLSLSSRINRNKHVDLWIDIKPALSREKLSERLIREVNENSNKEMHTILKNLAPKSLVEPLLFLSTIEPSMPAHQLTVEMRKNLVESFKHFPLTYRGLFDENTGIVTTGGVDVSELNPSTMESRIVSGLYFCGEVIDVDGPTGGYNLQIAFSTGHLAGMSASKEEE
ncbi:flavoprotein family protein [Aedoeadaptatus nemausensis]|uniref:Flavoprotein family protein n=2 Tax=Aedoeadaptatus nemausensis TaxID=2582829 RepID=A0A6V6Y142_9FIRM|nr:flavoprotein family protein [Peptoniphilus nemausensis]